MSEVIENQNNSPEVPSPSEAITYGGLLRIAREGKDLSVDQVSSQLRITSAQIRGLEDDNYKVFPTPVYARAHLRSYARLLGVDENEVVNLFNKSLSDTETAPAAAPAVPEEEEKKPSTAIPKIFVGVVFLGIVACAGYFFYKNSGGNIEELKQQALGAIFFSKKAAPGSQKVGGIVPQSKADSASQNPVKAVKETAGEAAKPEAAIAPVPALAAPQKTEASPDPEKPANLPVSDSAMPAASQTSLAPSALPTVIETEALKVRLQKEAEEKAREQIAAQAAADFTAAQNTPASEVVAAAPGTPLDLIQTPSSNFEALFPAKQNTEVHLKLIGKSGDCWFGIYQDNKLVRSVQLGKDQEKEFTYQDPVTVRVGNRLNGAVTVNGRPINLDVPGRISTAISFAVRYE